MIAIKNFSRKIRDRFLFRNRLPFFRSKSIRDFHFEIDLRLKTGLSSDNTDGAKDRDPIIFMKIDQRFLDQKLIPILICKSISDFHFIIAIITTIEKLIRTDQGSIFVLKTIRDFSGKIMY